MHVHPDIPPTGAGSDAGPGSGVDIAHASTGGPLRADVVARVTIGGELDLAAAPALDEALRLAARAAALVVLDLRPLEFADSSAAHLLMAADRRIRAAGGRFVVVRGPAAVERLLALTGVDRVLELVDEPAVDATGLLGDQPAGAPTTRAVAWTLAASTGTNRVS